MNLNSLPSQKRRERERLADKAMSKFMEYFESSYFYGDRICPWCKGAYHEDDCIYTKWKKLWEER